MPTDILRPAAVLSAQFTPSTPLADAVLNLVDTDAATYNESSTNGHKDSFTCQRLPVDRWKVTAAPDIVWRALNAAGGTARMWWKLGATTVNGTTRTLSGADTEFTEAAIARPGGGTWKPADFETLEWGYEVVAGAAGATRVSDVKASVPTSVYAVETDSVRAIDAVAEAPPEPVRFTVAFTLQDPEDIDYIDANTDTRCTVGSFVVPGTLTRVFLTLSRSSLENPRN